MKHKIINNVIALLVFFLLVGLQTASAQSATCAGIPSVTCDPNATFTFVAPGGTAESGPDYGCVSSQPNPQWYVWAADETGPIDILISTAVDVDYILYGPFSSPDGNCGSLTAANTIDCSYAGGSNNETIQGNVVAGQFYILLLTNFGGTDAAVTLTQNSGTGSLGGPLSMPACGPFTPNDPAVNITTSPLASDPNVSGLSFSGTGITDATLGTFDPSVAGVGTHPITLSGTSYGCPVTTTKDIVVNCANPVISTSATSTSVCVGEPLIAITTTEDTPGSGTITGYAWTGDTGPLSSTTVADPDFSTATAGTYSLVVTATTDDGCTPTASLTITVNAPPPPPTPAPDVNVCAGAGAGDIVLNAGCTECLVTGFNAITLTMDEAWTNTGADPVDFSTECQTDGSTAAVFGNPQPDGATQTDHEIQLPVVLPYCPGGYVVTFNYAETTCTGGSTGPEGNEPITISVDDGGGNTASASTVLDATDEGTSVQLDNPLNLPFDPSTCGDIPVTVTVSASTCIGGGCGQADRYAIDNIMFVCQSGDTEPVITWYGEDPGNPGNPDLNNPLFDATDPAFTANNDGVADPATPLPYDPIANGDLVSAPGVYNYYSACECCGCESPPVETTVVIYPEMTISVDPKSCDGMIADEYTAGAADPTDDIITADVMVTFSGPMPVDGTLTLSDLLGSTLGGTLTGAVTAGDLSYTFTGITFPGDGATTFDFQASFADTPGALPGPCLTNDTFGPYGDCSCMQYACEDDAMFEAMTATGNEATLTTTYVLVAVGTTAIIQESATAQFDVSTLTADGIYQVHIINYDPDPPSSVTPPAAGGDLNDYINPAATCADVDVSFPCYLYVEPLPEVTTIDNIVVCDLGAVDQAVTIVSTGTGTPGTYNYDWVSDILTIADADLLGTEGTDSDDTNGGSIASGSNITFTADDEEPGGDGTVAVITVTPFYQATDGDGVCPVDWCIGEDLTFNVSVASQITITQSAFDCEQNEFGVTVAGGYPDLAGVSENTASEYSFTIDGVAATPASGTVTNGGTFTFTGQTPGCHTIAVNDDLGTGCGPEMIDVEVYDPFNIVLGTTCTAGDLVINSITGGQEPGGTWCAGATPSYTITVNGSAQTVTATADFPITFSGLAEGTYDIVVADAVNCTATFQGEAYAPIVLTDNVTCALTDNSIDVTVTGGQPDHPGTTDIQTGVNGAANGTTTYAMTSYNVSSSIDGPLGTTDATGNISVVGGLTAGCHTLTFAYDLLDTQGADTGTDCSMTIDVEVYDPFNATFSYSCDANQIVVTGITGGQDPAGTWCTGTVPQYTVAIAGSTESSQTITTALEFPMTFTGLAEGTYDVVVTDANGCSATWQAEAYEPIALQSTGERCDLNNQISINVTGGQPDHPGTTDIITETNGTGSGVNTGDNYGLGNYTITLDGPLGTGTLIGTSTVPADGTIITNLDDAGNLLPCGSHDIHFTYDLYDDDGTDTGVDCEEIIRVDIYDLVDADLSTPDCGSINIDNVTGGFDPNCPNGYDTPTPGYTVTIEGPLAGTGIPGVPTQLYTHSTSPSSSTSYAFTPGDASGVPVNGLPGGVYEIVIIDGLSDGNCPFVEEIEIVGCCPASSDADTDYQLCGMNQPTLQPSTGQDVLPGTTPIFGDLPTLTIDDPATNLNIDDDTEIALNTDDSGCGQDAGGDGVDWFVVPAGDPAPDPTSAAAVPYCDALMISASICDPQAYEIHAFLRCDGDHDGSFTAGQNGTNPGAEIGFDPDNGSASGVGVDSYIPAGMVTVTVWPEIAIPDISYPNDPVECQVNLVNPCPGVYQLEVSDDDGNTYIADNSGGLFLGPGNVHTYDGLETPLPGTIGDLTLTITNPDAIAAFDGGNADGDNVTCREVSFERDYVCCLSQAGLIDADFGCPPEIDPQTGDQIGLGDPVEFTVLSDFMGDVGTLQLPNYQQYLVVSDAAGNIYDVFLIAETDGTGTLINDARPFSLPYADFANWNGYGTDYYFYSYNVFTSNPPQATCLPQGITVNSPLGTVVGQATTIGQATICTSPFEGCFDFTDYTVVYLPNALSTQCNVQTYEGEQGGITPFHYNKREMCIKGGTPPYTYEWDQVGYVRPAIISQREDSVTLRVVYADNAYWSVTITDQNGCTNDIWEFTNDNNGTADGDNPVLDIESADITHDNCITRGLGQGEGEICLVAEGGSQNGSTPDFMYEWSGPFTWNNGSGMSGMGMNCIDGLPYGWYSVTVTEMATAGTGESVGMGDVTEGWYWVQCERPSGRGKLDIATNSLTAYPNPFDDATTIEFGVTEDTHVNVTLFALTGQKIADLYTGDVNAQTAYEIPFESGRLPAGVYFVKLTTTNGEEVNYKLIISQ